MLRIGHATSGGYVGFIVSRLLESKSKVSLCFFFFFFVGPVANLAVGLFLDVQKNSNAVLCNLMYMFLGCATIIVHQSGWILSRRLVRESLSPGCYDL